MEPGRRTRRCEKCRLNCYFKPPLSLPERRKSRLEGWILGVC